MSSHLPYLPRRRYHAIKSEPSDEYIYMLKKQPLGKIRSYLDKGILAFIEASVVRKKTQGGRSFSKLFVGLEKEVKTLSKSVWVTFIETRFWQISSKDSN